ncbi:hypothetical protein MY11210_009677 [Beauveria gryllotalpidicola]
MGVHDEFSPLPTEEVDEDTSAAMRALEGWNESALRGAACRLLISVLLNILLFLSLLIGAVWSMAYARTCPTDLEQPVWSPAASALRNIHEIFPNAFSDKTQFMGAPSPKLDRIWENHYDLTTGISDQEAEQLTVPTIEFPEGSGSYIVLLDIFHSLHCLNSLRKSLHPEYYPPSYLRHNVTEEEALRHTGRSTQFRMFNLGMNLAREL